MKMKCLLLALVFQLKIQAQLTIPNTISPKEKVHGLSRFWQEVNYNFIYLDRIDRKRWDSLYVEMIPAVEKTPNDYAYYRLMQRFCATLKDGHTNVFFSKAVQDLVMNTMFGEYRMGLQNVDGKVIVAWTNKSKKDVIPVGSEVLEVNGIPVKQYMQEYVTPYISSSTDYVLQDWAASSLLQGLEGETFQVRFKKPDGKQLTLALTHKRTDETEVYPEPPKPELLSFKWYDNQIAYVALNSFMDNKIDTLFTNILPELYKAKGLIIDLRYNGGGNTGVGTAILQYLTNDTVLQHARYATRQHRPAFKAWGVNLTPKDTVNNEWNRNAYLYNHDKVYYELDYAPDPVSLSAKRIVVPTAILVGHFTASAAEDFLISADNQPHMIKIGERSFGSTGQPYFFELPGGGSARVCTKRDTYPDGREFVGYGVKPDIEVKPTLADYLQHKDPALQKALQVINGKITKR